MYKIIGADGRVYGPASAEQVRRWIGEGRINAQSSVQAEGSTEWKLLSTFPEFADALAAKAAPPPGPPPPSTPPPTTPPPGAPPMVTPPPLNPRPGTLLADEILARGYTLDIARCLERAWALYRSDFWMFLGVNAVSYFLVLLSKSTVVGLILVGPLFAGLLWFLLKRIRHEPAEFEDIFSGFKIDFVQTMLAGLVISILVALGLILCLAPGIYLAVAWAFTLPLIMDKRLPFWDAMEVSRRVVSRHWWNLFGLLLLTILINLVGALVCCVGIFITLPLVTLAWMYAYEDVFNAPIQKAA
jgi:hypothetical protein